MQRQSDEITGVCVGDRGTDRQKDGLRRQELAELEPVRKKENTGGKKWGSSQ